MFEPLFKEFLLAFIPLFVALNTIGIVPIFSSYSRNVARPALKYIIFKAVFVAFLTGIAFVLIGEYVLKFLGVTISDFKIAGGLLLLVFSIKEIFYEQPETKRIEGDFSVVPLAIPLLLGPAVLTTLLVFKGIFSLAIIALALFSNLLIGALILWYSALLSKLMGKDGMKAAGKIATILLSAIAIMLIRKGVFEMFNSRF